MSTLKFNAVNYCWYIRDDYMRANEFMFHLSLAVPIISIFGSLLDL